ncbi:MAG: glycosyltransferase family 4 protein [Salibacteraceae bacterium]
MSSFIRLDIEILKREFEVIVVHHNWSKKAMILFLFVKQFFQLVKTIGKVDSILVSFGGYWSFLPVVLARGFNKPVFIIIHGTDACSFPEIGYGNLRKPLLRLFSFLSYKWATKLLPVSESLMETVNTYYSAENPIKLGLKATFPNLNTPYTVIPNGIDIEFWRSDKPINKESMTFVTVATEKQFVRKGIDIIIEVAPSFPDARFYVVGCKKPSVTTVPENVFFTGRLPQQELVDYFQKSQFYLQLSVFEGFGLSLCEAMLCHCVPIGSSVNFIPEIINDDDLILKSRDQQMLHSLISQLQLIEDSILVKKGLSAHSRVAKNFPISKRQRMLADIL